MLRKLFILLAVTLLLVCAAALARSEPAEAASDQPLSSCSAEQVESVRNTFRLKRIFDEYDSIKDMQLRAVSHIRQGKLDISKFEFCFDVGGLAYRIWSAMGLTGAYESCAKSNKVLTLLGQLKTESIVISNYCSPDMHRDGTLTPETPEELSEVKASLEKIGQVRQDLIQEFEALRKGQN